MIITTRKPGRPKGTTRKEPTTVIRVPVALLETIQAMIAAHRAKG